MRYLRNSLFVILLIFLDQITKYLAVIHLKGQPGIDIIPGVFRLQFLEGGNSGAAFGILQGQFWFFFVVTVLILVMIFLLLQRMPRNKHYLPLRLTFLVLLAGAVGNFIDRCYTYITEGYNYVIDFLYFNLIDFPIFNVADCYVTVSSIVMVVLFMFYYKDADLDVLWSAKSKKSQEESHE